MGVLTLRARLVLVLAYVLVLAIGSMLVPLVRSVRDRVVAEVRQQAQSQAEVVAASAAGTERRGQLVETSAREVRGRVLIVDQRGIVIADSDRSAASRDLVQQFEGSPYFTIVDTVTSVDEIDDYLERGRAWLALGIPAGYHETAGTGRPATVQVIADGTDSNSTNVAIGYAQGLVSEYSRELAIRQHGRAAAAPPPGCHGAGRSPARRR